MSLSLQRLSSLIVWFVTFKQDYWFMLSKCFIELFEFEILRTWVQEHWVLLSKLRKLRFEILRKDELRNWENWDWAIWAKLWWAIWEKLELSLNEMSYITDFSFLEKEFSWFILKNCFSKTIFKGGYLVGMDPTCCTE